MSTKRPTREAIQGDLALLQAIIRRGTAIDGQAHSKTLVSADTRRPPRIKLVQLHEAIPSKSPARDIFSPFPGFDVCDEQGKPIFTKPPVGAAPWDALEDSWLGHALRQGVVEHRPVMVRELLGIVLHKMCASMAAGACEALEAKVFKGISKIGSGRPVDKQRDPILKTWRELGEPSLARNNLAQKIYGTKFGPDAATRKKLRNRCREAVKRALEAEQRPARRVEIDIL
jgi:hypothetical protein